MVKKNYETSKSFKIDQNIFDIFFCKCEFFHSLHFDGIRNYLLYLLFILLLIKIFNFKKTRGWKFANLWTEKVYNLETKYDRQILFALLIVLNSLKYKGFQKKFSRSFFGGAKCSNTVRARFSYYKNI